MCCAGVGTLSAHKMTTGRVSHQQISPIKGQIVIYRPSIGPDSLRVALRTTFVGGLGGASGESRHKALVTAHSSLRSLIEALTSDQIDPYLAIIAARSERNPVDCPRVAGDASISEHGRIT